MTGDWQHDAGRSPAAGRVLGNVLALAGWVLTAAGLAGVVAFACDQARDDAGGRATEAGDRPPGMVSEEDLGAPVWFVVFSPDGGRLATATIDGRVRVKDLATGRAFPIERGTMGSARCLAFSRDGKTLAVAGGGPTVHLWDLATGVLSETPVFGDGTVKSVEFSPDGGRLAVGTSTGLVALWGLDARSPADVLVGDTGGVNAVAFSPDGATLSAGGSDGRVTLWDVVTGRRRASFRAQATCLKSVLFSPDGRRVLTFGPFDRVIRAWDAATGEPRGVLSQARDGVNALTFTPGGRLAVARCDGSVSLPRDPLRPGRLHVRVGRAVFAVASSPDGKNLATGNADGFLRVWNLFDPADDADPTRVAFAPAH